MGLEGGVKTRPVKVLGEGLEDSDETERETGGFRGPCDIKDFRLFFESPFGDHLPMLSGRDGEGELETRLI